MSILNWALEQGDLNQREDWTKAEFCLLASKIDPQHPVCENLTFENATYQMLSHYFLPHRVEPVEEFVLDMNMPESVYLECKINNTQFTFDVLPIENPPLSLHYIFFESDFGDRLIQDENLVSYVKQFEGIDFWRHREEDTTWQKIDWLVSCNLALKILGEELTQAEKDACMPLLYTQPTWETYHPYIVMSLCMAVSK